MKPWRAVLLRACGGIVAAASVLALLLAAAELRHLYFNRHGLPDADAFMRFEFSTIGRVYDAGGTPLIELAREYRQISRYEDIPPIVRDAILAAEDKRFFSHSGIDYRSVLRVLGKIRAGTLAGRLVRHGRHDEGGAALFPQGGSTLTQQLVRGVFLSRVTAQENSHELRHTGFAARVLASWMGARSVNMLVRKREEIRLSLWLEQAMRTRFGSKRRAKEEILARYASFVYMGNGQYGFARAAEYYFGRPLATFTVADADQAAVLAGIAKAPRDYAPNAADTRAVLDRRNQTLTLMEANGLLSPEAAAEARRQALQIVCPATRQGQGQAPAVVEHVLAELTAHHPDLGVEDLLQGRIDVYTTADARVQRIVNDALEHGLARYERRHPATRGIIQGSVVVLRNRDGGILAEAGGRQVFQGRPASFSDYNRVTKSLRQPGSAMKPIVYLAAFEHGGFTLDTLVPDEPIGVPDGQARALKWISNYDGLFKGSIPIRQALAESRNAVAVWITGQIGIDRVLRTGKGLGVRTPLARYPATALGASDMNLLELANAYRTIASGIVAEPYIIRTVARDSGEVVATPRPGPSPSRISAAALSLIQEGLRGVVRLPTGTAHALASTRFPIAVMGKTGTTSDFRDAIFVGSTYGPGGITAAVRIGFDDNRSLGVRESGGRVALPVFQELMLGVYRDMLVGAAPVFPALMEDRITASLLSPEPLPATDAAGGGTVASAAGAPADRSGALLASGEPH